MRARTLREPRTLAATAGALVAAAGLGFAAAKLTSRPAAPSAPAADSQTTPTELKLDASYLKVSNIGLETVAAGSFRGQILGSGTVVAAPNDEAVVTAHAAGAVVRLFKRLGDPVRAGETLALVESREAASLAAERKAAVAKAALARANLAREQRLFEEGVSPRQDFETAQAEAAAANAAAAGAGAAAGAAHVASDGRSVAVTSPIAGRLTAATATLGAFVQPEAELFRVANTREMLVEAALSAQDASRVALGAPASVRSASGLETAAVVRSVTPTLNPETRSATVLLAVSGPGLTPGEAVQVQISGRGEGPSGLVLPEDAVQSIDGRDVVFVRTPSGFSVRRVLVSARSGGRALIVSGLSAGETVATRNAFLLKAELGKGGEEEE